MPKLTLAAGPGAELVAGRACCSAPGASSAVRGQGGPRPACQVGTAGCAVSLGWPAPFLPTAGCPSAGCQGARCWLRLFAQRDGAGWLHCAYSGQVEPDRRSCKALLVLCVRWLIRSVRHAMRCPSRTGCLPAVQVRAVSRLRPTMAGAAPFCVPVEEAFCQGCSWAATQGAAAPVQLHRSLASSSRAAQHKLCTPVGLPVGWRRHARAQARHVLRRRVRRPARGAHTAPAAEALAQARCWRADPCHCGRWDAARHAPAGLCACAVRSAGMPPISWIFRG